MAFRLPKGWMLASSPRRGARQPFRRTVFPRGEVDRSPVNVPAVNAAAAPAGAGGAPWWRALLDALAAAPRAQAAPVRAPRDADGGQAPTRRAQPGDESPQANSHDGWRPVTERLDRQREQLAGIDEHLRRLVEMQAARDDATAVYAPPA